MEYKTLLLNSNYEVLSFINERRAFRLLCKDKVEVLGFWDEEVNWYDNKIYHPAVLRLKDQAKRFYYKRPTFSRHAIIKRDESCCLYCGIKLTAGQITIDHVLPKSMGGKTVFLNCVVSCLPCNNKKANRTPEQAGMILIKTPSYPTFSAQSVIAPNDCWHDDWNYFLKK